MPNLAEKLPIQLSEPPDAISARVAMLRAIITSIPVGEREAVLRRVRDLLPASIFDKAKTPLRGGEVLKNVFRLFQQAPEAVLAAGEVKVELSKTGTDADPQAVRNALNYLNGRSVLRRVGYGRYQLADGRIVEGPP